MQAGICPHALAMQTLQKRGSTYATAPTEPKHTKVKYAYGGSHRRRRTTLHVQVEELHQPAGIAAGLILQQHSGTTHPDPDQARPQHETGDRPGSKASLKAQGRPTLQAAICGCSTRNERVTICSPAGGTQGRDVAGRPRLVANAWFSETPATGLRDGSA